jgi:hypothetical protein
LYSDDEEDVEDAQLWLSFIGMAASYGVLFVVAAPIGAVLIAAEAVDQTGYKLIGTTFSAKGGEYWYCAREKLKSVHMKLTTDEHGAKRQWSLRRSSKEHVYTQQFGEFSWLALLVMLTLDCLERVTSASRLTNFYAMHYATPSLFAQVH